MVSGTIKVAGLEPVVAILAKARDVMEASASLLAVLDEGAYPYEASVLRDVVGEFRTMMSQLNGN